MNAQVSCKEVVDVIRQALNGEIAVSRLTILSFDEVYAGDVEYQFGEWEITFFNDCDELDYCDSAISPDDRKGDFDSWCEGLDSYSAESNNPIDQLTVQEMNKLKKMLRTCQPAIWRK